MDSRTVGDPLGPPTSPPAIRLAYLVTHPIQYQAPLLAAVARQPDIDLRVFFCSDVSVRAFHDREFGTEVRWQQGLLTGYESEVLPAALGSDRTGIWTPVNHGLGRRLRNGRFDALWVHGYGRPYNLLAMAIAKRLGLRVLLRDDATEFSRPRGAAKRLAKALFFRILNRLVDVVLATGTLNRNYYRAYGFAPAKIGYMPNVIDNATFARRAPAHGPARDALVARFGLDPSRAILLFAGKLVPRKQPLLILDCIARMPSDRRPSIVFAGDGELAAAVDARASAIDGMRAAIAGFVAQEDLPAFYAGADILVLPSMFDSWGLVVNEAMACGLPVIASHRVGAAHDLVIDGETGWTFPADDGDALTDRLAAAVADPAALLPMRDAARRRADHFDIGTAVAGLRTALGLPRGTD